MRPLRIALTKGRLEDGAVKLLERAGYPCPAFREKGRRLILPVAGGSMEAVLCKAPDVITYVQNGVCDLGIVGKDTILEKGGNFYEMLDLGYGRCRFALAGPRGLNFFSGYSARTVASKYPNVAAEYFSGKKMDVRIIKIEGSVELAPLLGLADAIVDLVETGRTLKENGLEVIETICGVSARLIVSASSLKFRREEIENFKSRLETVSRPEKFRTERTEKG